MLPWTQQGTFLHTLQGTECPEPMYRLPPAWVCHVYTPVGLGLTCVPMGLHFPDLAHLLRLQVVVSDCLV